MILLNLNFQLLRKQCFSWTYLMKIKKSLFLFRQYECAFKFILYIFFSHTSTPNKVSKLYKTSLIRAFRWIDNIGQYWLSVPIFRHKKLCHFCSCNAVECEAHFVLKCPLYNFIRKFSSSLEIIVLGNLKSFFQLGQQVDITLYFTKATKFYHSIELVSFQPSWCTLNPIRPFLFLDFKSKFVSFQWKVVNFETSDLDWVVVDLHFSVHEDFWTWSVEILVFPSPTCYMLTSFDFSSLVWDIFYKFL